MRFLFALLISLCSILAIAQDDTAQIRKYLQTGMNEYVSAYKKKDIAEVERVFRKYFLSSYFEIDMKGHKMTLDEIIAHNKVQFAVTQKVEEITITVKSLKVSGNSVVTDERLRGVLLIADPKSPKKTARLGIESDWNTTYVKSAGKWMAKQGKVRTQKLTLNGKPWDPTK